MNLIWLLKRGENTNILLMMVFVPCSELRGWGWWVGEGLLFIIRHCHRPPLIGPLPGSRPVIGWHGLTTLPTGDRIAWLTGHGLHEDRRADILTIFWHFVKENAYPLLLLMHLQSPNLVCQILVKNGLFLLAWSLILPLGRVQIGTKKLGCHLGFGVLGFLNEHITIDGFG